jgi:predicted nucleic acid binding AN1-type Zn finger protein
MPAKVERNMFFHFRREMDISGTKVKKICAFPTCKKKLTLVDYPCRCEKIYCSQHRFPTDHVCPFNYKKLGETELLKTMSSPILSSKVQAI